MIVASVLASLAAAVSPAAAEETGAAPERACDYGICRVQMTPAQLLAQAETLVRARRFAEAEPLIAALAAAPEMRLQSRFLAGFSASEQGDFKSAAETFKAILADDPKQTRVRLELARAMLHMGQLGSADRQFRLAEQSGELPPDVAQVIRGARQVIRSKRPWRFDLDFGIAPDSNINNATGADRIDVHFGDVTLPIELDPGARARSGTGQTATVSTGLRLPVGDGATSVLGSVDVNGTNYAGSDFDDYWLQAAAGAEQRLGDRVSLSVEGLTAQRWFGGRLASSQYGIRTGTQATLSPTLRLGVQLDTRRTDARFDRGWSGWQAGLYGTVEKGVSPTMIASLGGFVRRDWLNEAAFSSTEVGATAGLGGELGWGMNFAVSGSASRAVFDAAMPLFSPEPRRDWRTSARVVLGNRKIRILGFSPQVSATYTRTDSSVAFFGNDRLRLRFAVARYF